MNKVYYFILIIMFNHNLLASPDNYNELDIFFTTPNIRNKLNIFRKQGKFHSENKSNLSSKNSPVSVIMQGLVIRKGHKPVIFFNNTNTLSSQKLPDSIIVNTKFLKNNDYSISVNVNNTHIHIKPGQHWDELHKKIDDVYSSVKVKSD